MRWRGRRESGNIEDRRRMGGRVAIGGGIGTIIILLAGLFLGVDPQALLQFAPDGSGMGGSAGSPGVTTTGDPAEDEMARFVSVVLADTEDVWNDVFPRSGKRYQEPRLVLFRDRVQSACGFASAAVGPFYCPSDGRVYLDLEFFDELSRRFGAPGDFAQAYVIAHEVGHHVQNLLGISGRVHEMRSRLSEKEYNDLSVRLELQADFLAGLWAHHAQRTRQMLEAGDVEEALAAASAIGDDRLQRQAQGYVVPDSFTHGTSEQRVRWFRKGLETGEFQQGNTFAAERL